MGKTLVTTSGVGVNQGKYTQKNKGNTFRKLRLIPAGMIAFLAPTVWAATPADATTLTVTANKPADKNALPEEYPGGQVASGSRVGMLGNRDIMNTPYSTVSYTSKQIANTPATTVMELLADLNASARTEWTTLGSSASQINIRGFNIQSQDVGFNGLYGVLPTSNIYPDFAERVELLAGPSAFLNGMPPGGSVGGAVNIVPKRATDTPITRVTTTWSSKTQAGAKIDVGRRFGDDNEFGMRFNGMLSGGNTAVDNSKRHLGLASLGLDYRGDRLRLSLDAGYQDTLIRGVAPYLYVPDGQAIPKAPKASNNQSPSWTRFGNHDTFGVLHGEYDLNDNVTVHASVGGQVNHQSDIEIGTPTLLNSNGDTESTPWNSPAKTKTASGEVGADIKATTGVVDHRFSLSATMLTTSFWGYGATSGNTVNSNIYQPQYIDEPDFATPSLPKVSTVKLSSVALGDTLSMLDDRLQFTFGGRLQKVQEDDYDSDTGDISSAYSQNALSPSLAVLVKPWRNISLYANYIQGLQQGTIVDRSYANAGQVFAPFKSKQYEAGIKADWGYFGTTLSVYQITQPSTVTDTATNTLNVDGEQRNRGVELQTFGEPMEGLRLLGGASYIDPVLTKTQDGSNNGKMAATTPNWQGNAGAEWDIPYVPGLTLTGRVVYTSWQYLDVDSPRRKIPSWTRMDAGLRYLLTGVMQKPITLRMDVVNLANRGYWSGGCCNSYVTEAEPRTVTLSAAFDF